MAQKVQILGIGIPLCLPKVPKHANMRNKGAKMASERPNLDVAIKSHLQIMARKVQILGLGIPICLPKVPKHANVRSKGAKMASERPNLMKPLGVTSK